MCIIKNKETKTKTNQPTQKAKHKTNQQNKTQTKPKQTQTKNPSRQTNQQETNQQTKTHMQVDWEIKVNVLFSPFLFLRRFDPHGYLVSTGARNHNLFWIFCQTAE